MSDLIERLRTERSVYDAELCDEAADEIERLRQEYDQLQNRTSDQYDEQQAEIERLRGAISDTLSSLYTEKAPYYQIHFNVADMLEAALEEEK